MGGLQHGPAGLDAFDFQASLPICHGNAWSLHFNDREGNGVECFVDTPFHVAQPFAQGLDLNQSDEEIVEATRKLIESEPEFKTMTVWREATRWPHLRWAGDSEQS